jgi:hypothetical protein
MGKKGGLETHLPLPFADNVIQQFIFYLHGCPAELEGFSAKDLAEFILQQCYKFPNLQYHCDKNKKLLQSLWKVPSAIGITAVGAQTGDDVMERFGMRYLLQNYASFVSDASLFLELILFK